MSLRILFTVQAPVVASWGPDPPPKPVINTLWDGDYMYFNIEKTECNFYSYKEAKDQRQKFGWV
jgi:hypothetical protein